jgi:Type IV secretory pathway, VirB11 components, and related ATPases involved in archaeal flagella biosynthesis
MTDQGTPTPSDELRQVANRRPHLREHLQKFKQIAGEFPMLVEEPDDYETDRPNVIYPVGGAVYCHVYGDLGQKTKYYTIEPTLSEDETVTLQKVKRRLLSMSGHKESPDDDAGYDDLIEELLEETTYVTDGDMSFYDRVKQLWNFGKVKVDQNTYDSIRYRLNRDIVGFGPLEPIMRDPQNEDIHVIGAHETHVDHGTFGMLPTTVDFGTSQEFDTWLKNMGERMGDPISDSNPIVDSTMPDGSRINIIYSEDVSLKGPSLTIRQQDEIPLSINQITNWGTLSPLMAAYLWICLENEQTVFVVGETASGKTTTLNASFSFIPRDSKIYTAEDTAEVIPPHDTWQQLLTREGLGDEANEVDMFDLVASALRSRPDYIIVGEVRGAEGRMAFQAAQTGHPVMLTFHASDIVTMIQRFTSEPINVPETFMGIADVALFQNRVKQGDDVLRRVTSVQEIEGYSKEMGGVVTRQVFEWDPVEDEHTFKGMNNSFVMEEQIAPLLGYADTRQIYETLDHRAEVVERMIQEGILGYHEVNDAIASFQRDGAEGLPFTMASAPDIK